MRSTIAFFIIAGLTIWSCTTEPEWKPLNLLEYGMPITVLAPDSADVKKMNLVLQEDISIRKGENYFVQIFGAQATTRDAVELKESLKEEVLDNPFFSEMVEEGDYGFIYKDQIDSVHSTYGFRFVRLIGDKEYVFQTGLIGSFTEDQVRKMYEAVQYREE